MKYIRNRYNDGIEDCHLFIVDNNWELSQIQLGTYTHSRNEVQVFENEIQVC